MKRYRERQVQEGGFQQGRVWERVIELANDKPAPEGAEEVADSVELHEWQPVTAAPEG